MHDTPERNLFGGAIRAFSHGCMRVQNPIKLAEVLLARDKGFSAEQVQEYVRRGGEIKLTTPIPVHITYFTAVVDAAGKLHYRPDIYALDGRVASKLEGQPVNIATASVDKSDAPKPEATPTGEPPAKAKSRTKQKAASSQGSIPSRRSSATEPRHLAGTEARTACWSQVLAPHQDRRRLALGAVEVHTLGVVDDVAAGRHRHRGVGLELGPEPTHQVPTRR